MMRNGDGFADVALKRNNAYAKRCSTGAWARLIASAIWRIRV
jgi:hypothetical protein